MADVATPPPIDAQIEVVTPENIAVHYRAAGPFRRLLAMLIDLGTLLLIVWALFWLVTFIVVISPGFAEGFFYAVFFVVYWFFFGLQEALFDGRTLGKRALGLRTITVDGQPINGLQATMRNFLRVQSFALPLLDLIAVSLNDRFQRIGDLVCGTVVITEDRSWLFGVAKLDDPRAVQLAAYLPMDFEVNKSLARALATYVERRRFFSPPRRREVAKHLGSLLVRRFELPVDTSHDLLLCALYYRAFIADRSDDESQAELIQRGENPFITTGAPAPVAEFAIKT